MRTTLTVLGWIGFVVLAVVCPVNAMLLGWMMDDDDDDQDDE